MRTPEVAGIGPSAVPSIHDFPKSDLALSDPASRAVDAGSTRGKSVMIFGRHAPALFSRSI